MKNKETNVSNQGRVSKNRDSLRRTKQLLKYLTDQLSKITDNDTIIFYLKEIEEINRQRIRYEQTIGILK